MAENKKHLISAIGTVFVPARSFLPLISLELSKVNGNAEKISWESCQSLSFSKK